MTLLLLISIAFAWADVASAFHDPNCAPGRHVIVHLFEWKWSDIAAECERFLGPKGFCGVQISPPNEHANVWEDHGAQRPWWERYQPVSYKLISRSGNEEQFDDMVTRCNNANVRIYVDGIINHMAAAGGAKGSGGSFYDPGSLSYPEVPFSSTDFNGRSECSTGSGNIEDYGDANQVRNCRLVGLPDLALGKDYVRGKIADFLNNLINKGVAGFRFDASKHMWPGDVKAILNRVNNLNTQWFPVGAKPFIYQEVIDLGSEPITGSQYTSNGRVTEFKYGMYLGRAFRRDNQLKWLQNFGEEWEMLHTNNALVFVDNHDNQRGHGAGGASILTFFDPRMYKMANAFMLAFPYGFTRLMSSYRWTRNWQGGKDTNDWVGPPHNSDYSTKDVAINADGTCGNGWVCEHRWRQIANMVKFRNVAHGHAVANWFDNGNNQIAFSRGDQAFIAINNEDSTLSATLQTGLSSGQYCDVISGDYHDGVCTGKVISVDDSGRTHINIGGSDEDPVVAIHVGSKVGSYQPQPEVTSSPNPGPSVPPSVDGYTRTVVFIKKQTQYGQDLFLRGGISHTKREGCSNSASSSPCAIPISHRPLGTSNHYSKYNAWKAGDQFLDWYGSEGDQGRSGGQAASGTPTVWTSNQLTSNGYVPLNTFGEHYWMLDVDMDCSKTEDGWFELKSFVAGSNGGWEGDIAQLSCTGSAGGISPYTSSNHVARCGFLNVFEFGSSSCRIDEI